MTADSGIRRARREISLQAILNVSASAIVGVYLVWLVAYLLRNAGAEQFGIWATVAAVLAPLTVLDAGLSYIDRWTLWLDLRILLRTMPSVLLARGR